MPSAFASAAAQNGTAKEPAKVVAFQLKAEDHAFTKTDAAGNKTLTGESKPVAKLRGVRSDGSVDKLAAWLWLDTPDAIDAFIASAPALYQEALRLRAIGEEHMGWPKRQSAAPAPKAEPAAPKASAFTASQAVEAEAKRIAGSDDPFSNLPF